MTYQESLTWLYSKLPMFQRQGATAYKKDLTNIRLLSEATGNPYDDYKTIHVAGTNGKGSTCHMLASVLQEAGYKTGLTTSPHLKDLRERIRVNGVPCSKEFVTDFVNTYSHEIEKLGASFFEVMIAMGFLYFKEQKVDVAFIETGLGGRLDSTNIIHPVLSIITNISLEHTQILGNTLSEIAYEKAGIIKPTTPVVIGEKNDETTPVFIKKTGVTHSKIVFAEELNAPDYESDLKGIYQTKNKKTVVAAIKELKGIGFEISETALKNGLKKVIPNTGLHGRWEVLQNSPQIIADTAHNPAGLAEIKKQLAAQNYKNLHLVLGFVNDKDVKTILGFFPKDAFYYFSAPNVPRKLPVEELKKIIPDGLNAVCYKTIPEALKAAKSKAEKEDLIYVGGSTFVVAEVI